MLFAEAQNAGAEINVTPSGELQISIRTGLNGGATGEAVGRAVAALATVLHQVSVQDSADSVLVTLSAHVPLDAARAVSVLHPAAVVEPERRRRRSRNSSRKTPGFAAR